MPYDNALGANNITKSLAYNIILVYGTIRSIKLWPYLRKVWKQYFNRSVVAAMVEYLRKVLCGHCYGESLETIYWTVLWATAMKFTIGIFLAKKIFVHGLLSIGYIEESKKKNFCAFVVVTAVVHCGHICSSSVNEQWIQCNESDFGIVYWKLYSCMNCKLQRRYVYRPNQKRKYAKRYISMVFN